MTKPSSPDFSIRQAIREVLLDGEWHPAPDVFAALVRKVPPGIASRYARRTSPKLEMAEAVQIGQRNMAKEGLLSARRQSVIDTDPIYGPVNAPEAKIRLSALDVATANSVSIDEFADLVGVEHNTLRSVVRAGVPGVELVQTRMGVRIHNDHFMLVTTALAAYQRARLTMRWARYNADFDGLWNREQAAWELVDGEPVLRKHVDRQDAGDE